MLIFPISQRYDFRRRVADVLQAEMARITILPGSPFFTKGGKCQTVNFMVSELPVRGFSAGLSGTKSSFQMKGTGAFYLEVKVKWRRRGEVQNPGKQSVDHRQRGEEVKRLSKGGHRAERTRSPQTTGCVSLTSHCRASILPCRSSSAPTTSLHLRWYSFTQSFCRDTRVEKP
ncbi:hypothetical protein CCH79_00014247 [Gambusia affinis]|uniref:Uncharacterized protein n=1 Tax=Gambusia affinis TaxID=33528 RepID=A0A315UT95_GAMAF|nr:hypothetical protein CCH79_00014247 [Gambusia affinis]